MRKLLFIDKDMLVADNTCGIRQGYSMWLLAHW